MQNPIISVNFPSAPTLLYKRYRKAVHQQAASICTGVVAGGLLSLGVTYTDAEYPAYLVRNPLPLAEAARLIGHPEYRPTPDLPLLPADTGTEAAFRRFTAKNQVFLAYSSGLQQLKDQIIESLGTEISETMGTIARPLSAMSIPQILQYLSETYGVITKMDLLKLKDECSIPCPSISEYLMHSKRLTRTFNDLAEHRAAIAELQQMEYLQMTTLHLPDVVESISDYLRTNPRYVNQTFVGMSAHVALHLTNPSTVRMLGTASATTTVSNIKEVEKSMDTMTELMVAMLTRMDRMEKAVSGKPKRSKPIQGPTQQTGILLPRTQALYCFFHGSNLSHTGSSCRSMQADASYSNNHKSATGPSLIEGKQGRA